MKNQLTKKAIAEMIERIKTACPPVQAI